MTTHYRMERTVTSSSSHQTTGHAAEDFLSTAEREKKEMQGLNQRLEVYISRVKQLEDTNKSLVVELDQLRGSLGGEIGKIKHKFSDSLSVIRKELAESSTGTVDIDVRVNRLRDDLNDYRTRYEEARREVEREKTTWGGAIAQAQAELDTNKSRYAAILEEEKRLYAEQDHLYGQLDAAKNELDGAIRERLLLQQQEDAYKAELEFLARVHQQEIEELRSLLSQAPADTREFFKSELAQAIREISAEYDKIIHTTKIDLETIFKSKIAAVESAVAGRTKAAEYRQEEISKMNASISGLRAKVSELEAKNLQLEREANLIQGQLSEDQRIYELELSKRDDALRFMREDCQTLIIELQALLNTKQTLDAEIAIYRKLVEAEEHRVGQFVEEKETDVSGEIATRVTFKRHAKGNVSIVECEPSGKYIVLENTSASAHEDISHFQIRRLLDRVNSFTYTIPSGIVLRPTAHIKIYAQNAGGHHSPPSTIVMDSHPSWGQASVVETLLINREGIEKASHIQTIVSSY